MHCGFNSAYMRELPTFEPNDYFWKNHWNEGQEEKWQAYARAIREIMADVGGFQLHDASMEDKLKYKETFRTLRIDYTKKKPTAKVSQSDPICFRMQSPRPMTWVRARPRKTPAPRNE